MRRVRAQARRARVPAEMMQLVAGIRHRDRADDLGIGRRSGIDVDDGDAVRHLALGIEGRDIGQPARLGPSWPCGETDRRSDRVSTSECSSLELSLWMHASQTRTMANPYVLKPPGFDLAYEMRHHDQLLCKPIERPTTTPADFLACPLLHQTRPHPSVTPPDRRREANPCSPPSRKCCAGSGTR